MIRSGDGLIMVFAWVNNLFIQQEDATNSKDVCDFFVEGSHHRNLSIVCIMQNAFSKGKGNRAMSSNSQYIVAFKNPRDQVGPHHGSVFMGFQIQFVVYTFSAWNAYEYIYL
jgi:hypothetical protein